MINVSGIGPKSALAILANEDHSGLINAIANNDSTYLTKFPGVGKKTAAQIVLDLKDKITQLDQSSNVTVTTTANNNDPIQLADAWQHWKHLDIVAKKLNELLKSYVNYLPPQRMSTLATA